MNIHISVPAADTGFRTAVVRRLSIKCRYITAWPLVSWSK